MTAHFAVILRQLGVEEPTAKAVAGQIRAAYLNLSKWHLYDGVIPCLEQVSAEGYESLIVSNRVPELDELVSGLGIRGYFSRVHSSAVLGYGKPNLRFYQKVLEQLRDTRDVTMIGDNYDADVQGALHAGLKAILVRKENAHHYPRYCKNLKELHDVLNINKD